MPPLRYISAGGVMVWNSGHKHGSLVVSDQPNGTHPRLTAAWCPDSPNAGQHFKAVIGLIPVE